MDFTQTAPRDRGASGLGQRAEGASSHSLIGTVLPYLFIGHLAQRRAGCAVVVIVVMTVVIVVWSLRDLPYETWNNDAIKMLKDESLGSFH